MEILNFLSHSEIVDNFDILDIKQFNDGFYLKIKVELKDNSIVHIKEYIDTYERNYSYHWLDLNGNLIIRWDNAPHHKNIRTYPHHFHKDDKVFDSYDIDYISIFKLIENLI